MDYSDAGPAPSESSSLRSKDHNGQQHQHVDLHQDVGLPLEAVSDQTVGQIQQKMRGKNKALTQPVCE